MRPTECTGLNAAIAGVTRSTIASAPSATVATRMRSPGFADDSAVVEHQARMRGAGLSDGQRERIGELRGIELQRARDLVGGARIGRVEDHLREIAGRDFRFLEHVLDDGAEQRRVRLGQREALFPCMREALARRAPGVEELARERGARLDLRDHVVRAEHECDGAVAAGLLGLALGRGEPAIADRDQRALRAAADGVGALQQRGHAGAHRAGQIRRANLGRQLRRGADHRGVELLGVRRRRGREEQSLHVAGARG